MWFTTQAWNHKCSPRRELTHSTRAMRADPVEFVGCGASKATTRVMADVNEMVIFFPVGRGDELSLATLPLLLMTHDKDCSAVTPGKSEGLAACTHSSSSRRKVAGRPPVIVTGFEHEHPRYGPKTVPGSTPR